MDRMIPLFKVRCDEERFRVLSHECFVNGYIGEGPKVLELEKAVAEVYGIEPWQVIAVNSGTSAMQLALMLLEIGPRDDVICSPVTCMADPHTIRNGGANIVWADCDPVTGLTEAEHVDDATTKRTRAALITDISGTTPRVPCIRDGVTLIQDAAQNFSGVLWGELVAISTQAIKFLTTGDGGFLIVRTDEEDAKRARLMRWFGLDRTASADFRCAQNIQVAGGKLHMTDLAACLGLANLPLALDSVEKHRANALWYQYNLPEEVLIPWDATGTYWTYMIHVKDRDQSEMPMADGFMNFMRAHGIHTSPVQSIGTRHYLFPKKSLPGAETYSRTNVAIPNGWWVTTEDREKVAEAVRKWVAR